MNKVKKNYLYTAISQFVLLSFSFITLPYVSSRLGIENYGLYSYAYAILTYFLIFAKLGILNYGTRTIAENKTKKGLKKTFFEIYIIQFLLTTIIIFIYCFYCILFCKSSILFSFLYLLFLIANYFDIAWFFQGIQDFKSVSIRNLLINLIVFPCVLLFIKNSSDVLIYVLICGIGQIIGNLFLFLKSKYYLVKKKIYVSLDNFKVHFKGMLLLFIPILTTNIYNLMDEVMLGNLSVYGQVGIYSCAKKIMYIPLAFITPLAMTMLPYISSKKKGKITNDERENSLVFTIWLGLAAMFGLILISSDIINVFFSEEYFGAILLIKIMSIYTLFFVISTLLRDVYFLPEHNDKFFIVTVLIGIPINLILNFLLIPRFDAIGACLSTCVTEGLVLLIRFFYIRSFLDIKKIFKISCYFFFCSFIMYCLVSFIKIDNLFYDLIIKIIVSIILYFSCTLKFIFNILKK